MAQHSRIEIQGIEVTNGPREEEGKVWRMSTVEAAIETVRQGLCYGWLPRHLIEADLRDGALVLLPLATGATRHIPLCLRYGDDGEHVAPAIRWFARLLGAQTENGETQTASEALPAPDRSVSTGGRRSKIPVAQRAPR